MERRFLDNGLARLVTADTPAAVQRGMQILIELHQKRWQSRGVAGCFALPRFTAFLPEAAAAQFSAGQLQLHWLEYGGQPIAAEYHILGQNVIYAYQSGIDPAAMRLQPGRIITAALVRNAIDAGLSGFDFLRGDETYKAHWRATPRRTQSIRVAPGGVVRLRHSLWAAGENVKLWLKTELGQCGFGMPVVRS